MNALSLIDYAIIIGFLSITVVAGMIMTRKAGSSLEHYFLGGHSLPWWLLGIAGMANWFDLTGTMIITSFLFMMGPRGLFVEFRGGAVLVLAFLLCYAGKWHRRSGCMTGAEWMTYRFGKGRAAEGVRLLSAVIGIVTVVMMLAYLIRGASLFLGLFFPFPPMMTTAVLLCITTIYTMSAGFYGVVLTDLVQGAIVLCSCVIISVMAWQMVPNLEHLAAAAYQVTGNPQWTSSAPAWHTPMPPGYENYQPLIVIAAFYLARNVLFGMGSGAEPRYFGAKSDRDCGLQSFLQALMVAFRWPLMIGFAVMGIYFVQRVLPDTTVTDRVAAVIHQYSPQTAAPFWHDLTANIANSTERYPKELIAQIETIMGPDWRGKLPLVAYNGKVNPEQILPAVLLNQLPSGLKGLVVVAMFAAMMSCNNGMVNGASAFFVKDIYQNFLRQKASNRELIWASYVSTFLIVGLGFYFGVNATSINDLWGWIIMGFTAGSLAPMVLRFYWWRCNAAGMIGGYVLGATGAILQRIFLPAMVEANQFVLMAGLSFAGTIVGSLLTEPTPANVLKHFYRTTRPFGFWGSLKEEFKGEQAATLRREHRNDILAVPFVMVWQVSLFLLPMQLVIKSYNAFFCTLPIFLVGAAGMYQFWWKALPGASANGFEEAPQLKESPALAGTMSGESTGDRLAE